MTAPTQYTGRTPQGEYLVTVFPAEGTSPGFAQVAFRRDQWETFDAPVRCEAGPAWEVTA